MTSQIKTFNSLVTLTFPGVIVLLELILEQCLQIHKDALLRTREALVTDLNVDIIYDELLGKYMFTPFIMEYIKVSFSFF